MPDQGLNSSASADYANDALAGAHATVRQIVVGMIQDLAPLMDTMFADVDDYLFARAEHAESTTVHESTFDAMRLIRANRTEITATFLTAVADAAAASYSRSDTKSSLARTQSRPKIISAETMSVLSKDEVEISVAISGIAKRSQLRYGREANTLVETLYSVADRKPDAALGGGKHPLLTESLVELLVAAIEKHSFDIRTKLSFLKFFERRVGDQLGGVYAAALARLQKLGVRLVEPTPAKTSYPIRRSGVRSPSGGIAQFADLQRCLEGTSRYRSADGVGGEQNDSRLSPDQVIAAFAAAKTRYVDELPGLDDVGGQVPSLQDFLLNLTGEHGQRLGWGRDEWDTIQLVSEIFEHIFANNSLSMASKALIARMQFPVLSVALVDRSLFSDPDHPARILLNRIAIDGIGWPASDALLRRNPLYTGAQGIVARLNEAPKPDRTLFEDLLQDWNSLVESQERRSQIAIRRLNESLLGKAKRDAAKRIVQTTINEMVAGIELPNVVRSFIADPLSRAMVMVCLREGTNGQLWQQAREMLDALLHEWRPGDATPVVNQLDGSDLLSRFSSFFESHSGEDSTVADSLQSVAEALVRARTMRERGEWGLATDGYSVEDLGTMEEIVLTEPEPDVATPGGPEDYRLESLEPGSWVEIDTDDPKLPLRCRLAAADSRSFVFSDDAGAKVRELSRGALLTGLIAGSIRMIREELVVEKAIDDLIKNLKEYVPSRGAGTRGVPP